ncbi:MAG: hypothetical protein K2P17_05135 [Helicobacteraceae bacterium]|nr:hypothetical protein [Helicobacteraceae bacterium]
MIINIIFTIIMLVLVAIDIKTTKSKNHKDFRSIILTLGVLGTFIGIFVGLLDFNINNMEVSIPHLLNGLKVAFYTSIAGMSLSILISIYQKFVGFKSDDKDSLDFIALQIQKLDKLNDLKNVADSNNEVKNAILKLAESNDNTLKANAILLNKISDSTIALGDTFQNSISKMNTNIVAINKTLSNDLIKQFQELRFTLSKELEKLSSDFNADVICSVSNLSKEFSDNINLHFSENFKRFNKAVDNLLSWQMEHKKNMLDSNEILIKATTFLNNTSKITDSLLKRDEKTIELYKEVSSIMQDYKSQNLILEEKLGEMRNLGSSAIEALKFMNTFFEELNTHLRDTNKKLISNLKDTNESLISNAQKIIKEVFIATIKDFSNINKKIISELNTRDSLMQEHISNTTKNINDLGNALQNNINTSTKNIKNLVNILQDNITSSAKDIKDLGNAMQESNKIVIQSYQKLSKDIESSALSISKSTREMISDINKDGIKHLKNTAKLYFNDMSNVEHKILSNISIKNNKYLDSLDSTLSSMASKYLETLEQISLSSIETSKSLNLINIEAMRDLNSEISNYIKSNSISLNKSNIEFLNMLEIVQKQIEIAIEKSNDMQDIARNSLKDIETSMNDISSGFKGDYEWFLRRIKEIIGQRL